MSKVDRDSDFTPSPLAQQQRILTRALGCGVEDARRTARDEDRDQALRKRIAPRQARPLAKALHLLERRSR
jgi:hypothetical protein